VAQTERLKWRWAAAKGPVSPGWKERVGRIIASSESAIDITAKRRLGSRVGTENDRGAKFRKSQKMEANFFFFFLGHIGAGGIATIQHILGGRPSGLRVSLRKKTVCARYPLLPGGYIDNVMHAAGRAKGARRSHSRFSPQRPRWNGAHVYISSQSLKRLWKLIAASLARRHPAGKKTLIGPGGWPR